MRSYGPIVALSVGVVACNISDAGDRTLYATAQATGTAPQPARSAPQLTGTLTDGQRFSLEDLRGEPAVVIFYRGSFCGLCIQRLRELDAWKEAYDDLDTRIVALSLDDPAIGERLKDSLDLDFPIVSVDRATLDRWGVWPDGEAWPMPAAFVIDGTGAVRYGYVGQTAADQSSDVVLFHQVESLTPTSTPVAAR